MKVLHVFSNCHRRYAAHRNTSQDNKRRGTPRLIALACKCRKSPSTRNGDIISFFTPNLNGDTPKNKSKPPFPPITGKAKTAASEEATALANDTHLLALMRYHAFTLQDSYARYTYPITFSRFLATELRFIAEQFYQ